MSTVQVTEDQTYVFKTTDFGTISYASVYITSLPTTGTLLLNNVAVTASQNISSTDIAAGHLVFVPNTDVTTPGSFDYRDKDADRVTISSGTMTLNVTPDAGPSALASSVTATENQTYMFQLADFGYSDTADKTADPIGSDHPLLLRLFGRSGRGDVADRGT